MIDEKILDHSIEKIEKNLSIDKVSMTFGEIIHMYNDNELIINPEFQKLFKWSDQQKTQLIESILLGIPTSSIFVVQNENGIWEIINGLQEISTILSFFGVLKNMPEKNNWSMTKGNLIPELNNLDLENLPMKHKLKIKRSVCRIEIINLDNSNMRFDLFKQLNLDKVHFTEDEIKQVI